VQTDRGLIYLIKQVELAVRRPFLEQVEAHGLNYAHYTALTVLHRLPGITSSELARRSFVRAQTMAEVVAALVEMGYARREADPSHGRQLLLYITPEGEAKIADVVPTVRALEDRMLTGMSRDQVEQFATLLRMARNSLRD
jgi:DNA-binding MarR family transcriptional regulator